MDLLLADRTRDDLHRAVAVIAPPADRYAPHAAAPCREQAGVPAEQPLFRQLLVIVPRCVEHHLDDAFHVTVGRRKAADIQAQAARDRGTDGRRIKVLSFYSARFDDIFSKRPQHRLFLQTEPQRLHLAQQAALPVAHLRQQAGKRLAVPVKFRPIGLFVDVHAHSPQIMRRL